jgi:uridine kinase
MFVIGITGLSCSGKTTLSEWLQETLDKEKCLILSMDDYYKELTEEQQQILYDDQAAINFDTPDAIDIDLLCKHLELIRTNQPVRIPKFDLGSCVVTNYLEVEPNKYKYLIVEGIFIYTNEKLFGHFDMNIWVETSEYLCALRRFIKYTRDIQGYSPDFIYNQCAKFVIPGKIK